MRFVPNPWCLFDILGNVWEWVADGYDAYPPGPVTDPTGPEASPSGTRLLRGGGWSGDPRNWFRAAGRDGGRPPTDEVDRLGFRVCATRVSASGR